MVIANSFVENDAVTAASVVNIRVVVERRISVVAAVRIIRRRVVLTVIGGVAAFAFQMW